MKKLKYEAPKAEIIKVGADEFIYASGETSDAPAGTGEKNPTFT